METLPIIREGFLLLPPYRLKLKIMSNITYLTEEGLKKLQEELHQLKMVERPSISRQIAEARDKGDLSENAEYDAAKDAQGLLELKISKLEELVRNARLLDESKLDTSKVSVLCKVHVRNMKNKQEVSYVLVAEKEADLKAGKISVGSPIGKGLLGKKVGEIAQITTPAGELEFEVLDISLANH
jgi:transcription elongation factor GreA